MTLPVPQIDPMPLPAPLWLLRTLLLLTFALHLLFMNMLLGGTVVAFACGIRRKTSTYAGQLAADLRRMLPSIFAFTITLGVAALLFLQVLYGHLLYASSVLIAVPWLGIVGMVLLAYYGIYYFSLRGEKNTPAAISILGVAIILMASVGFVYSNNFTLMLRPDRWLALYAHSPAGWNLNWVEPTLVPRYLHFLLGALAVAGLLLVVLGIRKHQTPYGRWLLEQGAVLFLGPTILNYLVGFWWLMTLPPQERMVFMGRDGVATLALGLGILFSMAAVMHLVLAKTSKSPRRQAAISVAAGVLTVACMVVMRDALRNAYLAPHFRLGQLQAAPQWSVVGLFLILFGIGLATLAYMLRVVVRSHKAAASAAASR